jgi:hypothetical protein
MKKYIILILCSGMFAIFLPSCLDSYLDKAPESGLTEQDVFSKYENFKKYFEGVYEGKKRFGSNDRDYNIKTGFSLYFSFWDQKYTWDALTDMSDQGRLMEGQTVKGGSVSSIVNKFTYDGDRRPILESMFLVIRTCNMSLQKMSMLKDAQQVDIDDYTAQAHFVRAFAHFTLFKIWGPMPYLTKVLGPDDQWDIPRLSKHETLMKIAADLDTAITYYVKADKMRRDNPVIGGAGHLNHPDLFKPNGCAALALKSRVLLYAASPLNNELGAKDWENAAVASWEAIKAAEQWGYILLSATDYKLNYVGTRYSDEEIWGWSAGNQGYNSGSLAALSNGIFASSKSSNSGECPTQNTVDKFETKWGEPLNTEADRQAAIAAGHYKDQDPYANRDPRFYTDIIYNEAPIPGYTTAKIYYENKNGVITYSELLDQTYLGITKTGYYQRKLWGDQSVKNKVSPLLTDPVIRLGELYLNYAEAANEAYGPNKAAPGASMTAVDAINKIRTRVAMPNVKPEYTSSTEVFRPRIKNERTVELCFEGHYYFDIRRWMDAPTVMAGPLMAMEVEKVATSTTYPKGYKYTRLPLLAERQTRWKDAMYYFPFNTSDNYKMKNFVPNPVW